MASKILIRIFIGPKAKSQNVLPRQFVWDSSIHRVPFTWPWTDTEHNPSEKSPIKRFKYFAVADLINYQFSFSFPRKRKLCLRKKFSSFRPKVWNTNEPNEGKCTYLLKIVTKFYLHSEHDQEHKWKYASWKAIDSHTIRYSSGNKCRNTTEWCLRNEHETFPSISIIRKFALFTLCVLH